MWEENGVGVRDSTGDVAFRDGGIVGGKYFLRYQSISPWEE